MRREDGARSRIEGDEHDDDEEEDDDDEDNG